MLLAKDGGHLGAGRPCNVTSLLSLKFFFPRPLSCQSSHKSATSFNLLLLLLIRGRDMRDSHLRQGLPNVVENGQTATKDLFLLIASLSGTRLIYPVRHSKSHEPCSRRPSWSISRRRPCDVSTDDRQLFTADKERNGAD